MVLLNNDGLGACLLVSLWKVKLLGLILGHGIVVRFTFLLAYVLCQFTCIIWSLNKRGSVEEFEY